MVVNSSITTQPNATALLAGVGSPHGDDQIGWEVAQHVQQRLPENDFSVRLARAPCDVLHWLDGVERLIGLRR